MLGTVGLHCIRRLSNRTRCSRSSGVQGRAGRWWWTLPGSRTSRSLNNFQILTRRAISGPLTPVIKDASRSLADWSRRWSGGVSGQTGQIFKLTGRVATAHCRCYACGSLGEPRVASIPVRLRWVTVAALGGASRRGPGRGPPPVELPVPRVRSWHPRGASLLVKHA